MKARFLRIDDRLVHGQVIVGWLPFLEARFLVVVNDRVAADPMRQEMMAMSVPAEVTMLCPALPDLPTLEVVWEEAMVLVASPADALACLERGLQPQQLNIGGLHARAGKEEIYEALHLDDDDRLALTRLIEQGCEPVFQPTPQNEAIPLSEIL